MRLWRNPVALFLTTAGLPFVVSFTWFVVSQRHSLIMEPEEYIDLLKRTGSASHMIHVATWKHFLARDPLCRQAAAVVIGSSRMSEVDASVVGSSTCNLYVDGLRALGFRRLAEQLPPAAAGHRPTVYVGIDHFWFFWADTDYGDRFEVTLLGRSRMLWRTWAIVRAIGFFNVSDLIEAGRRLRQPNAAENVWYADGHQFRQIYYAQKRAGIHRALRPFDIERSVDELFSGQVRKANLHDLEAAVRLLHDKGYAVRALWTPVSPAHAALARDRFPGLFQGPIEAVDRLAMTLPFDRYLTAQQTLDPTRFGCTERDYFDATHIDADCMRRLFERAVQ